MIRTIIFVFMLSLALVSLTGCATTEHGTVTDSVTVHMNCRDETKSYRGDPDSEIDMFTKCMERHGYAPDGKPLVNNASTFSEPAASSVK